MSKNQKNVFITGATGFLGSFLAKELLDKGYKVFALARAKNGKSAQARIDDALKFVYDDDFSAKKNILNADTRKSNADKRRHIHLRPSACNLRPSALKKAYPVLNNLTIIEGDIVYSDLGIKDKKEREYLQAETDIIIHSAALAELRVPLDVIRKVNVQGTRNVLDFAHSCKEKGRLRKVNYISTMYVVGNKVCEFDETMLDVGQGFNNTYEQTKFEAELLVRDYIKKGLNISVFRPSLIIGDSKSGKTNAFQNIYKLLHLFSQNIFDEYPINLESSQNLVNVDTVVRAISMLCDKNENRVYHTISPQDVNLGYFVKLSADYFGFKMPKCVPVEQFDFCTLTPVQRLLIEPLVPYFNFKVKFLLKNTLATLEQFNSRFPCIDKGGVLNIFEYCNTVGFIRSKELKYVKS